MTENLHRHCLRFLCNTEKVSLPQPVDSLAERDSGVLLSAQTITSETISTTTTTQITKVCLLHTHSLTVNTDQYSNLPPRCDGSLVSITCATCIDPAGEWLRGRLHVACPLFLTKSWNIVVFYIKCMKLDQSYECLILWETSPPVTWQPLFYWPIISFKVVFHWFLQKHLNCTFKTLFSQLNNKGAWTFEYLIVVKIKKVSDINYSTSWDVGY